MRLEQDCPKFGANPCASPRLQNHTRPVLPFPHHQSEKLCIQKEEKTESILFSFKKFLNHEENIFKEIHPGH